jgi:hypothetical protein
VRAFGAYEGGASTKLSFAGEGDEVRRVNLQADEAGPALILVLTAASPIVWDFAGVPVKRLRGVLVYGLRAQAVANLPEAVPVRFVLTSQGVTPCGRAHFAHKSTTELGALRAQVRNALGVPVMSFTGSYNPEAVHLDGGNFRPIEDKPIKASDLRSGAPLQLGACVRRPWSSAIGRARRFAAGDGNRPCEVESRRYAFAAILPRGNLCRAAPDDLAARNGRDDWTLLFDSRGCAAAAQCRGSQRLLSS